MGSYLFSTNVATDSRWVIVGLVISGVIFGAGLLTPLVVALLQRRKIDHRIVPLVRSLAQIARTIGFLWLAVFFLRYQGINPFVSRVWMYLVLVAALVWTMFAVRRFRRQLPHHENTKKVHNHYYKYLPQSKAAKRR